MKSNSDKYCLGYRFARYNELGPNGFNPTQSEFEDWMNGYSAGLKDKWVIRTIITMISSLILGIIIGYIVVYFS